MFTVIAGSRTVTDRGVVDTVVALSGFTITKVVSGGARGVDQLGEDWARDNDVPTTGKEFYVTSEMWKKSRGAGFARNADMAKAAQQTIAIWDYESRGTANMIANAILHNHRIYVFDARVGRGKELIITPELIAWALVVVKRGFRKGLKW